LNVKFTLLFLTLHFSIDPVNEHTLSSNSNGHYQKPASAAKNTSKSSLIKTLIASVYCTLALLVTAFVMVIVHDRYVMNILAKTF
jgi:hypothetical protein